MHLFEKGALIRHLGSDISMIMEENSRLAGKISLDEVASLALLLQGAKRVFVIGAGRSGLMMKAAAMRLMHYGFTVHVAGETTTPAISAGDVLVAASGSGTTSSIVKAAEKAHAVGATVAAISTTGTSPLATVSQLVVVIPAAQKQDFHGSVSQQYAGSLFEQQVLLMMDAVFQSLWALSGTPAEELWKQHANME